MKPLEKPPWVSCEHLGKDGCSIYKDRPPICGKFNCLWQCGLGTMEERPDKIGAVFAPTDGPFPATGQEEIQVFEAEPEALQNPSVMKLSRKLVKGGALVIGLPYGSVGTFRFMGPKKKVLAAKIAAKLAGGQVKSSEPLNSLTKEPL